MRVGPWVKVAMCDCGATYVLGWLNRDDLVCTDCGTDACNFLAEVVRYVNDSCWWKPWTWGDTHREVLGDEESSDD